MEGQSSHQKRNSISATLAKQPFANPWDAGHEEAIDPITDQMMASYANTKQLSTGSFTFPETSTFNNILDSSSQHSLHKSTDEIYTSQDPWSATAAGLDLAVNQVQTPQNLYQSEAFASSLSRSPTPIFKDYEQVDEIRVSFNLHRSSWKKLDPCLGI
jgi:hypothetical protein